MKLGMSFPTEWKDKSRKDEIPVSDVLYGYAVEDIMLRLEKSPFGEYLWITNEQSIGEACYKKVNKEALHFIYVNNPKKSKSETPVPGGILDNALMEVLVKELFCNKAEIPHGEIKWQCTYGEMGGSYHILLQGTYLDMQVPVTMEIDVAELDNQLPDKKKMTLMFEEKKSYQYFSYPMELILTQNIFEIMRKLELISNMEAYDIVNEILKSQSISGRHILEALRQMGEKEPKVVTLKRLEQVASYETYTYMKKKWQQYEKSHKETSEEWEVLMKRFLTFISPIWKSLCENEIFFDDWMPELERFLG